MQAKHDASCKINICDASYNASEGDKFRKFFEIYGGISSPNEREPCRCKIPATTPTCTTLLIEETYVKCLIVLNVVHVGIIFVFFFILCMKFFVRNCTSCKKRPNKQRTVQIFLLHIMTLKLIMYMYNSNITTKTFEVIAAFLPSYTLILTLYL